MVGARFERGVFWFPVLSGQFEHRIRMFEGSASERISQHGRGNAGDIITRTLAEPQVNFLLTRRHGDGTFRLHCCLPVPMPDGNINRGNWRAIAGLVFGEQDKVWTGGDLWLRR